MYLPGSFEFLPRIGMEKTGKLNKELDSLHTEENMQKCFDEYCDYYLDLENAALNYDKLGIINFPYFLRVYKTAFFWKKIFFEKKRLNLLETRRGYLYTKEEEKYRKTVDQLQKGEEVCLKKVLAMIYKTIGSTEELFQ